MSAKGARHYYLRNVLHDYPDASCIVLLRNISAAMSADSALLIDELVLPNSSVALHVAELDIGMMASLAGKERSEGEWRALLEEAGLAVKVVVIYGKQLGHGVIVAALS